MRELRIMMTVLVRRVRDSFKRKCFVGRLVRFAADRSGSVAMMFGLSAIPLMIAMGGENDVRHAGPRASPHQHFSQYLS